MEDEIDLKKYLLVLLKHWKIIAGITLAAVVVSAGITFLTPPVYEAKATLLCTGDAKTLLGLAKSSGVAAGAAEKLAGKLDLSERRTGALMGAVSAAARDNLIDITAKSTSPQKAADVANAWAEAFTSYATDYYKRLQPAPDELKTQAAAALAIYNVKNEALTEFQEQVKRNDTGNCLACAELLYEVQMLRREIEAAPDQAPSNALSRVFYQYQAKAYSTMFPGAQAAALPQIFIMQQASTETGQVTLADIDQLINILEKEADISGNSPELLLNHISGMKLKRALETIKLDELILSRDTARSSYLEAAKQLINAELARQAPKQQLRTIEIAAAVDTPISTVKWVNIGVAFVLGLIAGVFVAFAIEYFQRKKPRDNDVIASEAKQS